MRRVLRSPQPRPAPPPHSRAAGVSCRPRQTRRPPTTPSGTVQGRPILCPSTAANIMGNRPPTMVPKKVPAPRNMPLNAYASSRVRFVVAAISAGTMLMLNMRPAAGQRHLRQDRPGESRAQAGMISTMGQHDHAGSGQHAAQHHGRLQTEAIAERTAGKAHGHVRQRRRRRKNADVLQSVAEAQNVQDLQSVCTPKKPTLKMPDEIRISRVSLRNSPSDGMRNPPITMGAPLPAGLRTCAAPPVDASFDA